MPIDRFRQYLAELGRSPELQTYFAILDVFKAELNYFCQNLSYIALFFPRPKLLPPVKGKQLPFRYLVIILSPMPRIE
jgi:hypothetical protein